MAAARRPGGRALHVSPLFLAGFAALVCDATSFAVLLAIRISAIQQLALLASIGVGIIIFTNLIMLPMALSYIGVIKAPANQSSAFKISLMGGNAGIDAATNIVIEQANKKMLALVYCTVILFCFIVLRSWRAVACAVLPLVLTSILAQALLVWLGIGIKVATLPVIALGVDIGVDYALYVLGIVIKQLRDGATLSHAYHRMLLAFMFPWNMLGALVLLPLLAYFLLPPRLFKKSFTA